MAETLDHARDRNPATSPSPTAAEHALLCARVQQASDAVSARAVHLTEQEVGELIEQARNEVYRGSSAT